MEISIIVPVYGCPEALVELHQRVESAFKESALSWELILVNDACPKGSWSILEDLSKKDERVVSVQLSRNFGQHRAIYAGLGLAKGEYVVVMDCDLQDEPEEIPKLYEKLKQDQVDYVLAKRVDRKDSVSKKLSSILFYKTLYFFTDKQFDHSVGNFGIYHQKVIKAVLEMGEQLFFFPTMINWVGFHGSSLNIKHSQRHSGESSYNFSKLMNLGLDIIIAFSDKPLRLAVKIGFFFSFTAFIYALFIFIRQLIYQSPVMGWTSLIVSISFFSGLIIFFLGIVGIYLAKIYEEVKARPKFLIRQVLNRDQHDS